ncbi:uncharacterized protein LOC121497432 isoform X2 [Vulpes lagopus]|uniref:uncharacterized protein LOC121497432 isoform X2 n=1 Tax=Vulpes lagopus TaxID=494514 RepID=UPI001BCA086A|nr:uncharacterized protein LOC121497432 isoform X2 [Vulpes lagopus]
MSSPMIASCRPTCPMVLEEWEPGVPDTENVHPLSKETSGWPLRRSGQLLGTDSSPCTSSFRNQPWPKESLSDEEKGKEEEMEEDDSSFKLCVPGIVPLQSPLPKTFRSTDTVAGEVQRPAQLPLKGQGPFPQIWREAELPEACSCLGSSTVLTWIQGWGDVTVTGNCSQPPL